MQRHTLAVSFTIIIFGSPAIARARQSNPTPLPPSGDFKTLVVATESKSGSVIAVPPATSVTLSLAPPKKPPRTDGDDLQKWVSKEAALNGLQSADILPWHVVVTYDHFDEDGDNDHSGVYEEFWAEAEKFKRIFKSEKLNQTDYATKKGLYRVGDQHWPYQTESQVQTEVVFPFSYAASLEGFRKNEVEQTFSGYKFQCVQIETDGMLVHPPEYCFEPDSSVLRYTRGRYWYQTVYNEIVSFQGRNIARQVEVTDGGKPYLKLRVEVIELLSQVDEALFIPPSDAVGPIGGRVSGVQLEAINTSFFPQWPASLNGRQFTVKVKAVVGTNGHVISAQGYAGPPEGYKACEDAVRKWVFRPFLVLDKPVEVEQEVECGHN